MMRSIYPIVLFALSLVACRQRVSGTLESISMVIENPFGLDRDGRNPAVVADCSFIARVIRDGKSIDAGPVSVDNMILLKRQAEYTGSRSVAAFRHMQHWHITGSSDSPAFDDSILAPNAFRIRYPHPRVDTISRSAGFRFTYDDPSTDSVEVRIWYDSSGTVNFIDSTLSHPTSVLILRLPNTGSYSVTSFQLAAFPPAGQGQIWIGAERHKTARVADATFELKATSVARTYFMLKP
jgi:hypothetical protein